MKKNKTVNWFKTKGTVRYLLLIILGIFLVSCDVQNSPPGDDTVQEPKDEDYNLECIGCNVPSVFTQFTHYYFVDSETRPIFVYGKEDVNNKINDIKVLSNLGAQAGWIFDRKELVLNSATNNFTAEIPVNGHYVNDNQTTTVNVGDPYKTYASCTFLSKIIEERELVINDYYYAEDLTLIPIKEYDILKAEDGVTPETVIETIFADANITVDFPSHTKFNVDGPMHLTANYKIEIWNHALAVTSLDNTNQYDDKMIILVGMNGYTDIDNIGLSFGGFTYTKQYDTVPISFSASVCYLFEDKLKAGNNNEEEDKKILVLATAHELGHARGKFLTPQEQATPYGDMKGLTDLPHTFGHYGNHSSLCLMAYFPTMAKQIEASDNPHFCEGHIQMLLNTSFKLGE